MGNKIDGTFWDNTRTKTGTTYTEDVKEIEYGIQGKSGSTIVANPELDGTEPELTGLEVGGTKYAVPQGGSGSIAGVYMFPMIKASKEVKGFSKATIDFETLLDYLEASGVDVDEPNFFDYNETRIFLDMCIYVASVNSGIGAFRLDFNDYDTDTITIGLDFDCSGGSILSYLEVPKEEFFDSEQHSGSLRQIIMTYLAPYYANAVFNLPTYLDSLNKNVANIISIRYSAINELLCFDLKNVDGFLRDVLVEYTPGSGSDSGSI